MNWLNELLVSTVFQTVISGVLVFVVGETIQNFVLRLIQEYKGVIGRIDNELKFYANVIANPGTLSQEVLTDCSHALRKLSCDLEATRKQLFFRTNVGDRKISDAARRLIRLSNSLGQGNNAIRNADDSDEVRKLLNILELT